MSNVLALHIEVGEIDGGPTLIVAIDRLNGFVPRIEQREAELGTHRKFDGQVERLDIPQGANIRWCRFRARVQVVDDDAIDDRLILKSCGRWVRRVNLRLIHGGVVYLLIILCHRHVGQQMFPSSVPVTVRLVRGLSPEPVQVKFLVPPDEDFGGVAVGRDPFVRPFD